MPDVTLSLVPIAVTGAVEDRLQLSESAREICRQTADWYLRSGFQPPWISYLVQGEGVWLGACGYKGGPRQGRVEIAYHTFPEFEGQGIGTNMARQLVTRALRTDATLTVMAQTLPAESASTSLLTKLGFHRIGTVDHPEDGLVWEWEYRGGA